MPKTYAKADAMLVTGDNGVVAQTLPAKVQGYMAAGKPIIGAIGGETAQVIAKANCGFCGAPQNADELKENILKFISCANKSVFGINGYEFYEKYFKPEKFFTDLTAALSRCKK